MGLRGIETVTRAITEFTDADGFFESVFAAKERVLVMDYDGTLAPFHSDRRRALPYDAVPHLLREIQHACRTRVIVITGRSAADLAPMLGIHPRLEIWGTYGLERLNANGKHVAANVDKDALNALALAEQLLEQAGLADRMEVKLAAVAVHWRGLRAYDVIRVESEAYRILERIAPRSGLVLSAFEQGVELRLTSANKGNAVKALLSETSPNAPIAYLGDDVTDEDAFRVLNGRGLTVLVRPTLRFTAAQLWVQPPSGLIDFFHKWIQSCDEQRT